MADVPLTNVALQYRARYREAIELFESDRDTAMALLEEMDREPVIPLIWRTQVNIMLCWYKAIDECWPHCCLALQLYQETVERWPNLTGFDGAMVARQKETLDNFMAKLPPLIEKHRQIAESRQQESEHDSMSEAISEAADSLADERFFDAKTTDQDSDVSMEDRTSNEPDSLQPNPGLSTPLGPRTPIPFRISNRDTPVSARLTGHTSTTLVGTQTTPKTVFPVSPSLGKHKRLASDDAALGSPMRKPKTSDK